MRRDITSALRALVAFTVLTGVLYPLLVFAVAQVAFPDKTNGSLLRIEGKIAGSRLIGQSFQSDAYFWGRPSATTPSYNGAASSGSNDGPLSPVLAERVAATIAHLRKSDPGNTAPIPTDLVTASASGLDPHISPEAARWQIPRIARARGISPDKIETLVADQTQGRLLGIFGQPVVNVLDLNFALDRLGGGKLVSER